MTRYPLEPFFALTGWTMSDVQAVAPCNGSEWRRRKQDGVTEYIADRLAVAAGMVPQNVWPVMVNDIHKDIILTQEKAKKETQEVVCHKPCEECGTAFVPSRRNHRFCSPTCSKKASWRRRSRRPDVARAHRLRRRRYYAENGDYERAYQRRRYKMNAIKKSGPEPPVVHISTGTHPDPSPSDPQTGVSTMEPQTTNVKLAEGRST